MAQRFAFQRLEVYQVGKAVAQLTIENRRLWADLPGAVGDAAGLRWGMLVLYLTFGCVLSLGLWAKPIVNNARFGES